MFARRRTVILLLSMIIVSLISVFLISFKEADIVYAENNTKFSGGDGKEETPYQISTAEDFCALEELNSQHTLNGYFNVYFVLTSDIDLTSRRINPIGTQLYPFKGHLDGAGFSITNISINSTEDYAGLFGAISSDASLKDITISGEISGNSNVGGLVGLNQGKVTGCINRANVKSTEDSANIDIGGICGYNENIISDCYNSGHIQGFGVNTGGIVGSNAVGTIRNCFNIGLVESEYYGAGGIAGSNEATISCCYNSAAISAYSTVGGIVGSNTGTGIIENTYNTGVITVKNNIAGGICGGNEGAVYNSYNCQSIIGVSQKGSICGFISNAAIVDSCFSSSDRYDGKLTFRGNDYPNSAIIRDVDLANGDTLTNEKKAAALSDGRGAGVWTKRSYDETFCYYPELSVFYGSAESSVVNFSKDSTKVNRQTTEVTLGTLSYVYNGKSNEPDVYRGEELLLRDVDYSVTFSNNINAGDKNAAFAQITFINYFKGSTTKYFSVTKQPITVKWSEEKFSYTGKVQHPTVSVETGKIGDENITFEYVYDSNIEIGKHSVKAQLDAANEINKNYSFEPETVEYLISGAALVLEWNTDTLYYNGAAQHPEASIKSGIKESDSVKLIYTAYSNNINAQTGYTVKVTCDNKNYSLDITYTYSIEKQPITAEFEIKDFYYTGSAQYPEISKVNNVIGAEQIEFEYKGYTGNIAAKKGYTVTAVLADTITNANYVLNETIGTYEIKRQPITASFSETPLVYNAQPQYPAVSANSGVIGDEKIVFKISDYSSNINATNDETYSIVVSLDSVSSVNGNYVFEPVTYYYGIKQAEIIVAWDNDSLPLIYNAKPQHPTATIVSEVFDEGIKLLYGECNSVNVGSHYSISIDSENINYKITNVLEYEIKPMPLVLAWKSETSFVYNGNAQRPEAKIVTEAFDTVELVYGVCNNIDVGQDYTIEITCNNANYILVNDLTYSIMPKQLDVVWEKKTFTYDGSSQHPDATVEGSIQGENISLKYVNCENNFDVGVKYTAMVVLDESNPINGNYVLNQAQVETTYRINKKKLELINIKAIDREYNGKTAIELEGGELEGVISGDDITFSSNIAVIMSASAGENKSVMYMPSLLGEHSYRYRVNAPDITVNIYKAKFDKSTLSFNDLLYMYDGTIKSIQIQGDIPEFIKYEIAGNEQTQVGEYTANVHFIYNETNVEPISDIEVKWYIAASEYSIGNTIKLNIQSGMIEYGATFESKVLDDVIDEMFPKNVECLRGFNTGFYKDGSRIEFNGIVKIELSLDDKTLSKSNLKLYREINGELKQIEYELTDSSLVFITDELTNFYITVESKNNALAIGLGTSAGIVILLAGGFCILIVFLKKRKQAAVTTTINLISLNEETVEQQMIQTNEPEPTLQEPIDKEFVIDGIHCFSYQSFLASLNYKDQYRQKEICSYSTEKAKRCAAGKGNGKRKELYWLGKRIAKGSSEYYDLLEKAKQIINSN